ncbi:MAG: amidohydrolase family protein [Alphaproteobacteria bacterium]|nr:amidohydrolase family protein [Alphaproteobacteria bacterium]MBV9061432.1 amidohydrolase family protein [Alphaproteobacteria bacterium]
MKYAAIALAFSLLSLPTWAQSDAAPTPGMPTEQLAKPPADAKVWTVTSSGGKARHGQVSMWTAPDGAHWSRFSFNLRGFVTEMDEQNRFAPDGTLQSLVVRGHTPGGDAAETYEVKDGSYTYTSPVDHSAGKARAGLEYVTFGGTIDSYTFLLDHMLRAPDHSADLLPSGKGHIEPLTTLEVSNGKEKKTLTAYAVTGFGLSPFPVWYDRDNFFGTAGVVSFLPEGWESAGEQMSSAQDAALAKRAPELVAKIAKTPADPVAFKNVKLYDADAEKFRDNMTVIVANGRVMSVALAAKAKIPASAEVIDGTGKTLVPGLWDNHQHYGDDSTGPLLLASGITSVRDPGNQQQELWSRKKRIDEGQLLGPRIVPSLLIDGPGPYTAQVAEVVHNQQEALDAVRKAKRMGYFGIKVYGSMDPAWVKPMAALAHQLGLHVHGHIPHGMRPLQAVRDGYDEITHMNFVMMQAMPDDVVQKSNTVARIAGTGKYAADVDLHSPEMTAYFDELGRRHIAVDPTLVVLEASLVPDSGQIPPADAPYAETLPPQLVRGLLQSALAPTADMPRQRMRASFAEVQAIVAELQKRRVAILAGTDGFGFEVIHELELYVQAGLTPEQALATATINPARVYRLANVTGSLKKGKLAELALIDGDPQKNISDLRQVELVMRDGKLMKAAGLRAAIGISGPPKR